LGPARGHDAARAIASALQTWRAPRFSHAADVRRYCSPIAEQPGCKCICGGGGRGRGSLPSAGVAAVRRAAPHAHHLPTFRTVSPPSAGGNTERLESGTFVQWQAQAARTAPGEPWCGERREREEGQGGRRRGRVHEATSSPVRVPAARPLAPPSFDRSRESDYEAHGVRAGSCSMHCSTLERGNWTKEACSSPRCLTRWVKVEGGHPSSVFASRVSPGVNPARLPPPTAIERRPGLTIPSVAQAFLRPKTAVRDAYRL
jgi:hypothetical protein